MNELESPPIIHLHKHLGALTLLAKLPLVPPPWKQREATSIFPDISIEIVVYSEIHKTNSHSYVLILEWFVSAVSFQGSSDFYNYFIQQALHREFDLVYYFLLEKLKNRFWKVTEAEIPICLYWSLREYLLFFFENQQRGRQKKRGKDRFKDRDIEPDSMYRRNPQMSVVAWAMARPKPWS